jgi:ABC-2 type transport system permease protein
MVAKDLRMGPRSPIFLWAIIMPLIITFLMQVVFLTLFDPKPRLGIADLGESEITAAVEGMQGIELTRPANAAELRRLVENNGVDAGLVLERGFDAEVRAGARPDLEFYVSGESLASNRILLAVTAIDLVREVEGRVAPVEVVLITSGDGDVPPISERLIPSILLYVLLVAGIFVPAFMLVGEREGGLLAALLVTPVTMSEILLSKAVLGFITVIVMSYLTLAINGALGGEPLALLASLSVAAVLCIEIGLIYGTVARDAKTLYTLVKSLNVFLAGPVVFYIFPSWPQWIARLFPTYWFIDPVYRISLQGASLADVWTDLAGAVAISVVLVVPIVFLGRRMQEKLAAA